MTQRHAVGLFSFQKQRKRNLLHLVFCANNPGLIPMRYKVHLCIGTDERYVYPIHLQQFKVWQGVKHIIYF